MVAKVAETDRIERVDACREDHRSYIELDLPVLILVVYRIGRAYLFAEPADAFREEEAVVPVNRVFRGDTLEEVSRYRLPLPQTGIKNIVHLYGTLLFTEPAGYTFLSINVCGSPRYRTCEVSSFARDRIK